MDSVLVSDPNAIIINTSQTKRPDLVQMAYNLYREVDAEAVLLDLQPSTHQRLRLLIGVKRYPNLRSYLRFLMTRSRNPDTSSEQKRTKFWKCTAQSFWSPDDSIALYLAMDQELGNTRLQLIFLSGLLHMYHQGQIEHMGARAA